MYLLAKILSNDIKSHACVRAWLGEGWDGMVGHFPGAKSMQAISKKGSGNVGRAPVTINLPRWFTISVITFVQLPMRILAGGRVWPENKLRCQTCSDLE